MNILATFNVLCGVLVVGACSEKFGQYGFIGSLAGYSAATVAYLYFFGA
jgi:hypothetical protein